MEVKGRDLVAGLPKTLTITSQEVREALLEPINAIVESVRVTLERCPPELSADLVDRGLVLAGGGALLRGLDKLLTEETGLPVHVAEDPLSAVAEGTGRALERVEIPPPGGHLRPPVEPLRKFENRSSIMSRASRRVAD